MERWQNRLALVTGAGSGIGACIAADLANKGMIVIGCARNVEPIEEMAKKLAPQTLIPYKCDLSRECQIIAMFRWIEANHGGVDVLVNNAGVATSTPLLEICEEEMTSMFKVNVAALVLCSKFAIQSMLKRRVNDGHVFNVNSMLGHSVVGIMNFYTSSKYSVTALTQALRKELEAKNSRIKVTAISPGLTETKFHYNVMGDKAKEFYEKVESLKPQDVADALIYALSSPPHVQVHDVQLQVVNQNAPSSEYKPK